MLRNRESRKEDFTLHRANIKRCAESMKDKFLTLVLFKFSWNSDLKGSIKNAISWRFLNILKWNFLNCLILHVCYSVEKKTCFIKFSLKNRALNFRGVLLAHPICILVDTPPKLNICKIFIWCSHGVLDVTWTFNKHSI